MRDERLAIAGASAAILEIRADMERLQLGEGLLQPLRKIRRLDAGVRAIKFLVMD